MKIEETSTVLYDELIPLVRDAAILKKKDFIRFVATYIDKNLESLMIIGPYKKILMIEKEHIKPLYAMFNVTEKDITSVIKKCPLIEASFNTLNNPFYFLMTSLIMVYGDEKDNLSKEAEELAMLYMALRFYSSRQQHLLPFEASKEIMEYTINNLNNKYLIKTEKTIFGVLKKIVHGNNNTVGVQLHLNHTDKFFKYYITNVSTKINNTLGNIIKEYKKNYEKKNYLNSDEDRYNDEDNTIKDLSNVSSTIIGLAERVYNKMKTNTISEAKLLDATGITKLKVSSVKNTLSELIHDETDLLKEIVTCILQSFFIQSKNTVNMVKSKYFAIYCMNNYKVSNSKDVLILRIKEILDIWIKQYGVKYIRLNREATLINFRKAVYIYVVDCIIDYV